MTEDHAVVSISYLPDRVVGRFQLSGDSAASSIWERLRAELVSDSSVKFLGETSIELSWSTVLDVVREYGSRAQQTALNFRFAPDESAKEKIGRFATDLRAARSARETLTASLSENEIEAQLLAKGFARKLKPFQLRDLQRLLALGNGANFSVPGAGKTTVAFALHLLTKQPGQHLLVVCPKAAFTAWADIAKECMAPDAPPEAREKFTFLDGREWDTTRALASGATRFVISYDLMVRQQTTIAAYLARNKVHVILDEAHRMKAGTLSQRGAFLISVASLPARKDILTGTPMPQDASDMVSQLQFLWPGHGYDTQILRGTSPREVLGNLYVRTTKSELGLADPIRHYHQVPMGRAQLALYSVARSAALQQLTRTLRADDRGVEFGKARRSVMRLLQLSANPPLALQGMTSSGMPIDSGLIDKVMEEGHSPKMLEVADFARRLAREDKKSVIWTIFTRSIYDLEALLPDLNPVSLFGAVPNGSPDDPQTREGRLRRFHIDPDCKVMIANPAAAGEGISLHTVCHNAIYLDRSYVSTHYLQSIDRIHRLGLQPDVETHIHIYESKAPVGIGSIDFSVRRRLAAKIGDLQRLLDDQDLAKLEFDELNADDPTDYDVDLQDLVDLVEELEGRNSEVPID
jgi:SNF2 family DNA or RNA helicase